MIYLKLRPFYITTENMKMKINQKIISINIKLLPYIRTKIIEFHSSNYNRVFPKLTNLDGYIYFNFTDIFICVPPQLIHVNKCKITIFIM